MKPIILFSAAAFLFSGCDTVHNALTSGPPEAPRVRVFQADQKATYAAALVSLNKMGFRFTHGGPAEGVLQAVSDVSTGDTMSSANQYSLNATFEPTPDGAATQVSLRMTVINQADANTQPSAIAIQSPLRDSPLYEVFFDGIQRALAAPRN